MNTEHAEQLSVIARQASRNCSLWLEHPWVAHDAHERAASAWDNIHGDKARTRSLEHRRAAQYWAGKEAAWTKRKGCVAPTSGQQREPAVTRPIESIIDVDSV